MPPSPQKKSRRDMSVNRRHYLCSRFPGMLRNVGCNVNAMTQVISGVVIGEWISEQIPRGKPQPLWTAYHSLHVYLYFGSLEQACEVRLPMYAGGGYAKTIVTFLFRTGPSCPCIFCFFLPPPPASNLPGIIKRIIRSFS